MTQIEAVFRMNSKFGSSFPGIPFRGSRDPCFPGWAIISPNTGVGNCQILPFRINPIDTNTQSLTCNPSQNEGYKKRIPPSRYRHMTSGFIFKIFFVDVSKGEKLLPLHLLLSARFRVQLAACPGDLEHITMEDGCSAWFDLASSAFCCRSWEVGGNFKMPKFMV